MAVREECCCGYAGCTGGDDREDRGILRGLEMALGIQPGGPYCASSWCQAIEALIAKHKEGR